MVGRHRKPSSSFLATIVAEKAYHGSVEGLLVKSSLQRLEPGEITLLIAPATITIEVFHGGVI